MKKLLTNQLTFLTSLILTIILFMITAPVSAQWSQANGPEGGAISDVLLDGSDLYAVTTNGGVYKSGDGGSNWSLVGADIVGDDANTIIKSGSTIIAGSDQGAYLSNNAGANWSFSNTGFSIADVSHLLVSGSDIYATTAGGVYVSGNDGVNWSGVGLIDLSSDIESIAINGGTLWAGTDALYKSTNSGVNWAEVTNVGFTDASINFVYVSGSNTLVQSTAQEGIKYTADGGSTWSVVTGIAEMITTISANAGTLYAGTNGGGIYTSSDDGASWSSFSSTGLDNDIITRVLFDGTTWYAGTGGGVYKSTDSGANWIKMVTGMKAHTVNALLTDGTNVYAGTAGGGIFKSIDSGSSWVTINSGITGKNYMVFSLLRYATDIYAGTSGGVVKTSNSGTLWVQKNTGLSFKFGGKSMVSAGNNILVLDFLFNIYTTSDGGDNWTTAMGSGGNTFSGLPWSIGSDNTSVYASGFFGDVVMKSTDAGTNWVSANTGITNSGFNVTTQFSYDGTNVYAATAEGMFRTDDNGASWVSAGTGLSGVVNAFAVDGNNIYAGTEGNGVYLTSSQGASWAATNTGLGNQIIASLAAGSLYAGSKGSGVWSYSLALPPTILQFSPTSGPVGTEVIITGTNFDPTPANNIIFFGATQATVTAATATELTVTVPSGATYMPITVLVNGLMAYSSAPFMVTFNGVGIEADAFAPKVDFSTNDQTSGSYGTGVLSVAMGDLDGDGKSDLVTVNVTHNTISIFRNNSTSAGVISYAEPISYGLESAATPRSVKVSDIDGDGRLDIITANRSNNTVSVFRNTSSGTGTINFANKVDFTTGFYPFDVSIGDIDGDGKNDLSIVNQGENTVSILRNTSTIGTINYAAKVDFTVGVSPLSIDMNDLDGDGKIDLAIANYTNNSVSILRNTSVAGSISYDAKIDIAISIPQYVTMADLDNDNKVDLVVINGPRVSVFRNMSSGVGVIGFASAIDYAITNGITSVAISDLDGDQKNDLAVAGAYNVYVLKNSSLSVGVIDFSPGMAFIARDETYSMAIGDLDGDDQPDLVVANGRHSSISVFRNTVRPPNTVTDITAFSLPEQSGTTTIDAVSKTISLAVVYGTDLTSLIPTFTLSSGASSQVGATAQVSATTSNDFSSAVVYAITAEDGINTQNWTVSVIIAPNTETNITSFSLPVETGSAVIDAGNHTISLQVPYATDVTALVSTFSLSAEATAKVGTTTQVSGTTPNDFTNVVTYAITAGDGTTTQNWMVTITAELNSATDILAFSFAEQTGPAIIDAVNHTVDIEVAYGTNLQLTATFTLSAGALATVNSTTQISGSSANIFIYSAIYTITPEDVSKPNQDWVVTVTTALNIETDIIDFSFSNNSTPAIIDGVNHSISVYLNVYGTDVTTLLAGFTLSGGATAKVGSVIQESNSTRNDFSSPLTYTIIAEDGVTTQDWVVTVTVAPNTASDIITFDITEQTGAATIIDANFNNIALAVPFGTDVTALVASFTLSEGATATVGTTEQISGTTANDFTAFVTYTVTAEDGIAFDYWTVMVQVKPNTEADILTFSIQGQIGDAVIDTNAKSITIEMPFGTDVTSLVSTFTLSADATGLVNGVFQQSGSTINNFIIPITYTITAGDATTIQYWTVTVNVQLGSSENDITAFSLPEQASAATIDATNKNVFIEVVYGTSLMSLIPSFELSAGATANVIGVAQVSGTTANDFTNPLTYTITAEDGTTTQDWTITVTVAANIETEITAFSLPEQTGDAVIDANNKSIRIEVATGTDVTALVASFTLSDNANATVGVVAQVSGTTANDFTNDVAYSILAEDGTTTQDWVITVTVAPNNEAQITNFSFAEQTGNASIDAGNHTITIEIDEGTNLSALVASFTLSSGATASVGGVVQESGITANDFTSAVDYVITAEDGSTTQEWIVTVEVKTVLGIDDAKLLLNVGEVYPNPFHNEVRIPINIPSNNSTLDISLIDLQGRVINTDRLYSIKNGEFEYVLDVTPFGNAMQPGTYIVRIKIQTEGGSQVINKKVIYQLD
jgi:photosystem II stability/assembly factor-like uncharacterized protein